ncbi:tetratricopeptide repeat protein [Belliella baltica DSM 15883]|uniref:Tetratricopeptide repeat protein n=1 Tax=Belliella baltica (strain DSM 15883 / CIP 108006 / LMG 21964 / BA134) TaxID=866536 RepID=I3Z7X2_BELBD|nr:tetratricopeptide repeat protein [Belliella baltica]AFL85340.1 tetratricopeptide repeat protein [Belliella baltica DSM 15883]
MKFKFQIYSSLFVFLLLISCQSSSNEGDDLFAAGKYEEAIKAYDEFLSTNPRNIKALYNRGRSYEELENFEQAEKDFITALDNDSKNVQVMLSLSNLFQKQKNHSSALLYADRAVEIPGAPSMAYFMKARALHQLGNTDEALKEYSAAIKMDTDFGQAYYNRGLLKLATNKKTSGCEDLTMAMKLNYEAAAEAKEKYCK